nr:hypothetical protein [Pseudomonas sp. H3(2019)]
MENATVNGEQVLVPVLYLVGLPTSGNWRSISVRKEQALTRRLWSFQ